MADPGSSRFSGSGGDAEGGDGGDDLVNGSAAGGHAAGDDAAGGKAAGDAPGDDAAGDDAYAPEVRTVGTTLALHFSPTQIQSRMSLLSPDALDLEYPRLMMGFLLFNSSPARISMVGLGGGSLPKFCHRHLPETCIDVVEIDSAVIALRETFRVPPESARFTVVQGDGAQYVAEMADATDVLLVDGYGPSGIPAALCSQAFYADCHAALREAGMLVLNFHVEHPLYETYLDRVRAAFGASMFEVVDDDMTNSVVFACKGDLLDDLDQLEVRRPSTLTRDAWRQLMPTFKVMAATLVPR